jgi:hypothetical protein
MKIPVTVEITATSGASVGGWIVTDVLRGLIATNVDEGIMAIDVVAGLMVTESAEELSMTGLTGEVDFSRKSVSDKVLEKLLAGCPFMVTEGEDEHLDPSKEAFVVLGIAVEFSSGCRSAVPTNLTSPT